MKGNFHIFAGLMFLALPAIAAEPNSQVSTIDHLFVCPETLPSDQARTDALSNFMESMSKAAPDEGIVDVLRYRKLLLQKHACTETLRSLQASRNAILDGAVLEQAWIPVLNNPNVGLSVSTSYIESFTDPRYPSSRAIDTYVKITFTTNQQTNVTRHVYDTVVSHNVYYCGKRQYALIENDYFLSGTEIFKDQSVASLVASTNVYDVAPTPPGSLNELAANWTCQALKGNLPT